MAGTLRDPAGSRPVQISYQLPGLGRIDEGGPNARSIHFAGETLAQTRGAVGPGEEALYRSLIADLPENIFQELSRGMAVRLLAARATRRNAPANDPGVLVINVLALPARQGQALASLGRNIAFDVGTLFLAAVAYRQNIGGRAVDVETRFENWSERSGQFFPGAIIRFEDGIERFRVDLAQASTGPALPATAFRP